MLPETGLTSAQSSVLGFLALSSHEQCKKMLAHVSTGYANQENVPIDYCRRMPGGLASPQRLETANELLRRRRPLG